MYIASNEQFLYYIATNVVQISHHFCVTLYSTKICDITSVTFFMQPNLLHSLQHD